MTPATKTHASPVRALMIRLISVLIALLFAVFILEIFVRLYCFGANAFSLTKMNSMAPIGESGYLQSSKYSEIYYELKPNINSTHMLHEFKTNEFGMRDNRLQGRSDVDNFTVAVLGDSVTMGHGVDLADTYHSVLETRLNKDDLGLTFDFLNFAVSGYDPNNYAGVVENKLNMFDPDMIIIGFTAVNDFDLNKNRSAPDQYVPKRDNNYYVLKPYFLYEIMYLQGINKLKLLGPKKDSVSKNNATSKDSYNNVKSAFDRIADWAEDNNNVPVVVVYLTTFYSNSSERDAVKDLSNQSGMTFIDTSDKISGKELGEYFFIPFIDAHPNEKGHELFADILEEYFVNNQELFNEAPEQSGTQE